MPFIDGGWEGLSKGGGAEVSERGRKTNVIGRVVRSTRPAD